jgi:hypothetical protein
VLEGEKEPEPEERSVRMRLLPGGMVKLELVLEPDEADLLLRAVDRVQEVRARPAEPHGTEAPCAPAAEAAHTGVSAETSWPSRADGAVKLAESFLTGHPVTGTGGERFQVMVHIDQEVLGPDGAWAATLEDGTRVSAETLRRVACDCGLVAMSHNGEALNIGRRSRAIPPAIRRALRLRDRGCAFPGCTHTRFLHGHHLEHWLHGGHTRLDNLLLLCGFHHHLVHEGGWTVTIGADGAFAFSSPAGTLLSRMPPREPCDDILGRQLDPSPELAMPQWDGKTPDYNSAVGWLLEAG